MGIAAIGSRKDIENGRVIHEVMANFRGWRGIAAADAGRSHNPNPRTRLGLKSFSNFSPPSIAQVSESQTRIVNGGTFGSPSFTMSKWA